MLVTVDLTKVAVTSGILLKIAQVSFPIVCHHGNVSLKIKELRRDKNLFSNGTHHFFSRRVVLDYMWQQPVAIIMS